MKKRLFLILLLFCVLPLTAWADQASLSEGPILLNGMYRFSEGDDFSWRLPGFNDSHWQSVPVPASWYVAGVRPWGGYAWYRIRFHLAKSPVFRRPALYLGRIRGADEVYLNGTFVGREGKMGSAFVDASLAERLYMIPGAALNYGAENELSIRIAYPFLAGGIFAERIWLGEYPELMMAKIKNEARRYTFETVWFTFLGIYLLFCFFLGINGIWGREYTAFLLVLSVIAAAFVLDSLAFYKTGLKTPLVQSEIVFLISLLPAAVINFYIRLCKHRSKLLKGLMYLWVGLAGAAPFLFLPGRPLGPSFGFGALLLCFTAVTLLFSAVRAYRRQERESKLILLSLTGLLAAVLFVVLSVFNLAPIPSNAYILSIGFFCVTCKYGLIVRYARFKKSTKALSQGILDSQERERKRVARELHDGIAQSLQAIKLNLQIMQRKAISADSSATCRNIPEIIEQLSGTIRDVRNVAMDLRPSFLEERGIMEALRLHARDFEETTGIRVHVVTSGEAVQIPAHVTDNVYRIFQEALNNVMKHAAASDVQIWLRVANGQLRLRIKDCGKGFSCENLYFSTTGIGIPSMRERAELLGGRISLKSVMGKGTVVDLEVPLR